MRRFRVIVCLLISDQGLVKTRRFRKPVYIGDPINAAKIYSEKQADELVVLDIDATRRGAVRFDYIEDIVSEAFMPVGYGGGVRTVSDVAELIKRGVEKVVINTANVESPDVVAEAAARFGSQAVIVSVDVAKSFAFGRSAFVRGGSTRVREKPLDLARRAVKAGAGEILLTAIDREGAYSGYDLEMVRSFADALPVPVIANGGAGKLTDLRSAIDSGASAAAAGSLFVFAGKDEGVLINYPEQRELETIWRRPL